MIGMRDWLLGAALGATMFTTTYRLTDTGHRSDYRGALRQVASDSAGTVCLAEGACLALDARNTLFIFFRVGDCPGGLYDTVVLEELYRAVPRTTLNVVGVVQGMTTAEARAFASASGITYPLYVHPARLDPYVTSRQPGTGNRPRKVLVDHRGAVAEAWSSVTIVHELREDAERVRQRLMRTAS